MSIEIIVLLVVACLLISAISAAIPSTSQRRQSQLRQAAIQYGMQVRLAMDVKLQSIDGETLQIPSHAVIYRIVRTEDTDRSPWNAWRDDQSEWRLATPPPPEWRQKIIALLAQLPSSVIAIEDRAHYLSVYWNENDNVTSVKSIYNVLSHLLQLK